MDHSLEPSPWRKLGPIAGVIRLAAFAAMAVFAPGVACAAATIPMAGCYERVYDAVHLRQHKGQIVRRVQLSVKPSNFGAGFPPISGELIFWVIGHKQSFSSSGACEERSGALRCNGSLSAAEADDCKGKHDGVRDCREPSGDAGSFRVTEKPGGVLVTITARLEVAESNEDAGPPFLYLDPGNAENHSFLLPKAADTACSKKDR